MMMKRRRKTARSPAQPTQPAQRDGGSLFYLAHLRKTPGVAHTRFTKTPQVFPFYYYFFFYFFFLFSVPLGLFWSDAASFPLFSENFSFSSFKIINKNSRLVGDFIEPLAVDAAWRDIWKICKICKRPEVLAFTWMSSKVKVKKKLPEAFDVEVFFHKEKS